jgi:U3 small nucleolar RNA-associated protein 19
MGTSPEEIEKRLAIALEVNGSLNGIADLLALASPGNTRPQLQHKAIYALYRTYALIFTTMRLDALRIYPSPPAQAVRQWLLQKLEQFLSLLTQQLYSPEPSISVRSTALSPGSSYPLLSPPLYKYHFPYYASALPRSPAATVTRESTQYTLGPSSAVYSRRPPTVSSAMRPEMSSLINSSNPMTTSGGSSFARSGMQHSLPPPTSTGTLIPTSYLLQERPDPPQSVLETTLWSLERLTQIPSRQNDIHSFFLPMFAHKPTALHSEDVGMGDPINEDDWRAYFDEPDSSNAEPFEMKERRASKVPIHEALYSVKGHRVQFTYAWLSLLRYIKNSPQLSFRVLAILHRAVIRHLTRPVLLMDWIVTCVDFGKHRFNV